MMDKQELSEVKAAMHLPLMHEAPSTESLLYSPNCVLALAALDMRFVFVKRKKPIRLN